MSDESTLYFGLTKIRQGETLAKDGYKALNADRDTIDLLLWASQNHTHDGGARLEDPSEPPTAVASATGGTLPAGATYYYSIAYLDALGLETAASAEVEISTADVIDPPEAPVLDTATTGGSLSVGLYAYAVTFQDAQGGETEPSDIARIQVSGGTTTNVITMEVPEFPTDAIQMNVYRARPGQEELYLLDEITVTGPGTYTDDGSLQEDTSIQPPVENATSESGSITVTVPGGVLPAGVLGWRLYRTLEPGVYDEVSLVHNVVETTTEDGTDVVTSWIDDGDPLFEGAPQMFSATSGGSGAPLTAANIEVDPVGGLAATDLQAALEELDTEKAATGHTHTAQDATGTAFTPAGNLAATDVQAALVELDTEKAPTVHGHAASEVVVTPAGNLAATDVQAALEELDTDFSGHSHALTPHGHGSQAPTFASPLAVDAANGKTVRLVLTAAITIDPPANPVAGQELTFVLIQDGTGGWAVTWDTIFKQAWAPDTTAGATNVINFVYDGTNWVQTSSTTGL